MLFEITDSFKNFPYCVLLKYNKLPFQDWFGPGIQACFFQIQHKSGFSYGVNNHDAVTAVVEAAYLKAGAKPVPKMYCITFQYKQWKKSRSLPVQKNTSTYVGCSNETHSWHY
jgi:hypothetical protein